MNHCPVLIRTAVPGKLLCNFGCDGYENLRDSENLMAVDQAWLDVVEHRVIDVDFGGRNESRRLSYATFHNYHSEIMSLSFN